MAKIFVTDITGENPVPFLRGILTRSLTDAGMTFEEAYQVASDLRQQLGDGATVTNDTLYAMVLESLRTDFSAAIAESYAARRARAPVLQVRHPGGELLPFSRIEHIRCLAACGLSQDQASNASGMILNELGTRQQSEIGTDELRELSQHCLDIHFGSRAAERYRVWMDFIQSGRPLILLIGGVSGSGKSTIATELAHRLGIVRTQSTDMLREVMRMLIPERLLPDLHRSSFDPAQTPAENADDDPLAGVIECYQRQLELLAVPCEAVITRAIRERVSLIIEGVHVHPGLAERLNPCGDAVLVSIMLGVLKPEELRARLSGRRHDAPARNTRTDVSNFQRIWYLQAYLLNEADRIGTPILINDDQEAVTTGVLRTVIDVLDAAKRAA